MHKLDSLLFRRPLEEVQSRLSRFRRLEECWRVIEVVSLTKTHTYPKGQAVNPQTARTDFRQR